jgi:hypothetical protein
MRNRFPPPMKKVVPIDADYRATVAAAEAG